ncbi:DUF58 domain-containing protein [Lysinibacillus piscis]|uniref:DUF58 domain-containing protein n=1 Tax=Lysinibacillus piscis TaxID=2518931 RepID=A0ABQ5NPH0_9BACI|nr:DUF58 domain-containing protein [Lysinibacillus sp. KH24]GLC90266.1 hypothetical protein LYSBPC_33930 [Lysinibacillus sp. KH24]
MKKWWRAVGKHKHFAFVVLLMVAIFCYAMFQGGFVSWFVFFTMTPFLLYALMCLLVREEIVKVTRIIEPTHIENGQSAKVTLIVERKTYFPFAYLTMEELVNSEALVQAKMGGTNGLQFVGFRKTFIWQYTLECMPRGEHRYQGVTFMLYDFFGWAKKQVTANDEQVILVYPRIREMKYAALQAKFDKGTATSSYSIVKDTTMAVGLRNYVPGDRFSWIHWKAFAKTQTLQTKEFEDRQSQEVVLLLNAKSSPLFEEKVELVASMLQTIVKERGDASFISLGADTKVFPFIQGHQQLGQVMYHLAAIKPVHKVHLQLQDEQIFQRVATLLYVTDTLTDEVLHLLANIVNHCICFVIGEEPVSQQIHYDKKIQIVYVDPANYYYLLTEGRRP